MIKLLKPFNWKGDILEAGTQIGLGDIEDKLIASGAAERCTPGHLDAYEKAQNLIEDLRKEIAEKDSIIADLQKPAEVENADQIQEEEPEKIEEATKEDKPREKPKVGRTK